MDKEKIRKLVVASMLGAITIVLGMTPVGLIPLGFINATTMHIPVIIGAILEGPVVGAMVGLVFGISSMARAYLAPTLLSFALYNPLISIFPRVMIGIVSYYVYALFANKNSKHIKFLSYVFYIVFAIFMGYVFYKNILSKKMVNAVISLVLFCSILFLAYITRKKSYDNFALIVSSFLGSMTNTILLLGGVYIIYAEQYMKNLQKPVEEAGKFILGIAITSGIPEAIVCVILVSIVVNTVKTYKK